MALPSSLVWEVRTTGSNLNGGAFDARVRAAGTDYSQQDGPQATYTDLKLDAADGTKVTSSSRPFQATDVGNTIRIPSGITGMTAGVYCIQSVTGGVAVLDRACGTAGTSQGTGSIRLGGAIASLSRLASDMVAKNLAFVKSGSYAEAGTVTFAQDAGTSTPTNPPSRLIGYAVTRADYDTMGLSRPEISIGGTGNGLTFSGAGWSVENLSLSGGSVYTRMEMDGSASNAVRNCKFTGFTGSAVSTGTVRVTYCEITGATAGVGFNLGNYVALENNYIHDSTFTYFAVKLQAHALATRNVIANIATGHGISLQYGGHQAVLFNTIHNVAGSGLNVIYSPDPTGL
ncbi:MAG TPA: right-handed parallel beta-helix repeat-containing protein, partial [Isosphaeraceae bacterium]|nr:right-handed parallel beta-helix repeat-containing protein [Isosphaeraceae bacterium]